MSIVDSLATLQKEGFTQKELSGNLHIDQSYLSRILKGERKWPEHLDSSASKMSWKVALSVIEERTNGYIKNRLKDGLNLHPSAIKEILMVDLDEAKQALGGIILANANPEKQREQAERVVKEIDDVLEIGAILKGVIIETFELNKKEDKKK